MQMPPLRLDFGSKSGDIRAANDLAGSPFDASGFTVNFKTAGAAQGASIARAAASSSTRSGQGGGVFHDTAQAAGELPIVWIVAGLIAFKVFQKS